MKALILAAGRGERLGALTRELPKPMLPIASEPLIVHTVRYLASHGFDEIVINVHFRPEAIRSHLGDGRSYGVKLHYSHEAVPLGTAGGVRNALDLLCSAPDFLVIYGDVLLDQDLAPMVAAHRATGAAATLLVHRRTGSNSLVELAGDHRITAFVERPTEEQRARISDPWVNSGVQLLTAKIVSHLEPGHVADLPRDVYEPLLDEAPIYGFPLSGFRVAIDSPERYAQAQAAAADGSYRLPPSTGPASEH